MSGWLSGPRDSRPLGHSAIDGGGDPFSGARVVSVAHFEPAAGMQGEALDSYKRRFGTLFVDESTRRRGGIGSVVCATNVLGEQFALKTLVIPERDERASEAEYERYEAGLKTAFRQEFECHKAVSGLKGFPHLYGMGEVAGTPAIVMEWVCGETLAHVCDALAVDGAGRMPTLVAAQIGRDVFDLLAHLDFLEGGFVHRDISLANVMVRTSRLSLAEQVEEGFFDVCLIDFGSSTPEEMQGSSFTRVSSLTRKATADFAPPEMLTEDIAGIDALRKSPKIDVYATASVIYRLACGRAPFDLEAEAAQSAAESGDATDSRGEKGSGKNAEATKRAFSPYRVKTEVAPARPVFAHAAAADIAAVVLCEPEVDKALRRACSNAAQAPSVDEVRDALAFVDDQLASVLLACLSADQGKRPTAHEAFNAFSAFCGHYLENVVLSFQGEPLIPCTFDGSGAGSMRNMFAARLAVRIAAWAASVAVLVVVAVSAAYSADGMEASLLLPGMQWQGALEPWMVVLALAAPVVLGAVFRGPSLHSRAGFIRASFGVAAASVVEGFVLSNATVAPSSAHASLAAALFAAAAAAWCPFVADFSLAVVYGPARKKMRGVLPAGAAPRGVFGAATVALEEPQGDRVREDVSAEQEVSADQEESADQEDSTLEDPRKGGGQSE